MTEYDYKKIVIKEKLGEVISIISGIFLCLASAIMFINMITRTAADFNIRFVYELAQLCGAGVASFSIPYASIKRAHTEMDIITSHLKPKARGLLEGIAGILTVVVMVYITTLLVKYAWARTLNFESTVATHLPMWIFRWTYAIGMLITLIAAFLDMVDDFRIALGKKVVRTREEMEELNYDCPELGIQGNQIVEAESEEGGEKV